MAYARVIRNHCGKASILDDIDNAEWNVSISGQKFVDFGQNMGTDATGGTVLEYDDRFSLR